MEKLLVMMSLAGVCSVVRLAWTEDVTPWRGEARTLILHDHVKVGVAPDGFRNS